MTITTPVAAAPAPTWMTPAGIKIATGRGISRIREALQNGSLHGHQACFGGLWRAHSAVVDAWVAGLSPEAQQERCACRPVVRATRGKAAAR